MRTAMLFILFLLLAAMPVAADVEGVWTADRFDTDSMWLTLSARERGTWMNSMTVPVAAFSGLPSGVLSSPGTMRVAFELSREAGRLALQGHFTDGKGSGHFTFTPDAGFRRMLEAENIGGLNDRELLLLALNDAGTRFIREVRDLGFSIDGDTLVAMVIHRATPAFVREMRATGLEVADAGDAIAMRIHGVTAEFVREMRQLGLGNLDRGDFMAMRIHGVTPSFVRRIRDLGYPDVTARELLDMRIHGVTPEFIEEMRKLKVDAGPRDLVRMKIHGVDRILAKSKVEGR